MGNRSKLTTLRGWPRRLADWMNDSGFLAPRSPVVLPAIPAL